MENYMIKIPSNYLYTTLDIDPEPLKNKGILVLQFMPTMKFRNSAAPNLVIAQLCDPRFPKSVVTDSVVYTRCKETSLCAHGL